MERISRNSLTQVERELDDDVNVHVKADYSTLAEANMK